VAALNTTALNTTALPPPATFSGWDAYAPSYLDMLTTANQTTLANGTANSMNGNHTAPLRARRLGEPSYGNLGGHIVGVFFSLVPEDKLADFGLYPNPSSSEWGGSMIEFVDPGIFNPDIEFVFPGVPPQVEGYHSPLINPGIVAALATCDGPALVLHSNVCWELWKRKAEIEKQNRLQKGGRMAELRGQRRQQAQRRGRGPAVCAAEGDDLLQGCYQYRRSRRGPF
jgi:hypothetical protein